MVFVEKMGTGVIVTVILYIVGMIVLGIIAGKKIKNAEDFSSASQSLSWYLVAGSTIATCMGANMVIGKYDLIYQAGMSGVTASLFWWFGWLFLLLMAKRLRESGAASIPAFLEIRYNRKTQKISSWCVFIMTVSSCAAQFLSIGTICEALGITSRANGVWLGAALVILFTVFSGLWGVALTDTVQSVVLMIAFGIIFPIAVLRTAGGWNAVVDFNLAVSPERMNAFSGIAPVSMIGWALYYGLSTGSDPAFAQRIFAARDTKSAIKGQLAAWLLTLIIVGFVSAVPGLAISKIFPNISHGSEFTPLFIITYLPTVLKGIMIASLLGLMLTSGDTYLLLLSSTITDDIVRARWPKLKGRKLLFLNRLICAGAAVLICGMALYVDSIYQLFKTGGGAYGAGVFLPLFLGCFWKRAKAKAVNAGMLLGTLISFAFDMLLKIPLGLELDGVLIGAAICLIVIVGGSLWLEKKGEEEEDCICKTDK